MTYPTDAQSGKRRLTDDDMAKLWAWYLTEGTMTPAVRHGFGLLLQEVELARAAEKVLPEWRCPNCGATTRARMADAEPQTRDNGSPPDVH